MISAIPTQYNGYKFRSRLEARWAVFFDKIGVGYEYEPEGLILSTGEYYLPDFYLTQLHCFFEVKRKGIINTREGLEAVRKIQDGQKQGTWSGVICFGDPVDDNLLLFCHSTGDTVFSGRVTLGIHPELKIPYFLAFQVGEDRAFFTPTEDMVLPVETCKNYRYGDFVSLGVLKARTFARQKDFRRKKRRKKQWIL